jgi:hypothetical protein
METAEQREPYESRGSRTVLGEPGGESPPGHSTEPAREGYGQRRQLCLGTSDADFLGDLKPRRRVRFGFEMAQLTEVAAALDRHALSEAFRRPQKLHYCRSSLRRVHAVR